MGNRIRNLLIDDLNKLKCERKYSENALNELEKQLFEMKDTVLKLNENIEEIENFLKGV